MIQAEIDTELRHIREKERGREVEGRAIHHSKGKLKRKQIRNIDILEINRKGKLKWGEMQEYEHGISQRVEGERRKGWRGSRGMWEGGEEEKGEIDREK